MSSRSEAYKTDHYTVAAYIELEKSSKTKFEYIDGFVYAMAGGTYNHGLLCGNIFRELSLALPRGGKQNCKPLSSEIKLHIGSKNSYVHPDAMVVCGEVEKDDEDVNSITNPTIIVEVLSKSTADFDRSDKFHLYRQIPTLKEYILIDQFQAKVEVFFRPENADLWRITVYEGMQATMILESIDIQIKLENLYFDVEGLS